MRNAVRVCLDGSLMPLFRKRFAARLCTLLHMAAESKQSGVGVLSLPEVDQGLNRLAEICTELEPDVELPQFENARSALWPKTSSTRRKALQRAVSGCTARMADDAQRLIEIAEPCLGVFPENTGWSRDEIPNPRSTKYTPKAYFLNALYRGSSNSLQELPVLNRVFGATADELLQAILAFSSLESEFIRLKQSNGYFDHVLTALLVGNQTHLQRWAQREYPVRALPPLVRRACSVLRSWILTPDATVQLTPCGSQSKFDIAVYHAFAGIARQDVDLINRGVAGLFETWTRTNLAVWDGRQLPFINFPAIAILRTAIRIGLAPDIPIHNDNDRGLVYAPDPQMAQAPFALYPGIDLMLSERGLEPATLFVGERVLPTGD